MIIHCDGSCFWRDKRMGVGIAFFEDNSPTPFREEPITILGLGSSNVAEYHAIINALRIIITSYNDRQEQIIINSDSQVVIYQITGQWRCNEKLIELNKEVMRLYNQIDIPRVLFNWCPRINDRQKVVDRLSKQANPYYQEKLCVN
jgi:ribonuclease HI